MLGEGNIERNITLKLNKEDICLVFGYSYDNNDYKIISFNQSSLEPLATLLQAVQNLLCMHRKQHTSLYKNFQFQWV